MRIPAGERALAGAADHRPVRERVGEREADLDEVGAALDGGLGELRRLAARPSGRSRAASGEVEIVTVRHEVGTDLPARPVPSSAPVGGRGGMGRRRALAGVRLGAARPWPPWA